MTDPVLVTVSETLDLLYEADQLLRLLTTSEGVATSEITDWHEKFDKLREKLQGNRRALHGRVLQALGAASVCWSNPAGAGEFDSTQARLIGDGLIEFFEQYCDSLPLVRHVQTLNFEEDSEATQFARLLFEVSVKSEQREFDKADHWDTAPSDIKRVLTATAAELLASGVVQFRSDGTPPVQVPEAPLQPEVSSASQRRRFEALRGLPPNIPMPEGFHSDSGRPQHVHDDDGTVEGCPGCMWEISR